MTLAIYVAAAAVVTFFLYRVLYGTDQPHIKGLPEVQGLPLFGSMYELGENHAKVAQGWVKKYGPVFQVRMGNRVRSFHTFPLQSSDTKRQDLTVVLENRFRKHLRVSPPLLDHAPVRPNLAPNPTHLPHRRLLLPRLHHRDLPLG